MNPRIAEQLERLPELLGSHMLLTLTALAGGIALSIPLVWLALSVRRLQGSLLGLVAVIQTIPGLALLALMVPLLGRIGFLPAVLALTLYSLLPILRNAITGIENVEPDLLEAARGLGMTPTQTLWRVQVPLAAPVILAGIRTATVWTVGIATLATPVGAPSLGDYIFSGLQTQNPTAVLVGCAAAAALALVLDGLIRLMESAAALRSPARFSAAGVGLLLVILGALWPTLASTLNRPQATDKPKIVVGAKAFTEQYILADLIAARLSQAGYPVQKSPGMGSTILFDALKNGSVDVYVDYSGTLWANAMKRTDTRDSETVLRELAKFLKEKHGIVQVGELGFENAYALAMPRARAAQLGVRTLGDLARVAPQLRMGGDYEFFGRPEWNAVQKAYDLRFKDRVRMDPTLMYPAVKKGQVDVISAFSSDGRIAADDLVVLEDTKQALPPYDAILLISRQAAEKPGLVTALKPLVGAVSDTAMRDANKHVDVDKGSVAEAAKLLEEKLPPRP